MEWHYAVDERRCGPVPEAVLVRKINSGELPRSTLVWNPTMSDWIEADQSSLAAQLAPAGPPPLPSGSSQTRGGTTNKLVNDMGTLTDKVLKDLRELTPQFLMPLDEIRSFKWLRDQNFLLIAGIGLFPLLCLTLFDDLKSAYWALALYFSTLWALFFYRQFPSPQVTRKRAVVCFFGTGVVSIALLLTIEQIPPLSWLRAWAASDYMILRFFGMFGGVAVWEEACKLLMVLVVMWTSVEKLSLQTLLFYGLMSGLGFGIYEGVSYQMGWNLQADNVGTYYLLNIIRLTTLPFLHAIWTGIAGYFIGLSLLYASRRHGLVVAAILIPALLHALHNTLHGILGLAVDFLSVLALVVYLRQSAAFEASPANVAGETKDQKKDEPAAVETRK